MTPQAETNFERIAAAIVFIKENFKRQPGLDEIAARVNLSPFHFQKMFTDWAGVSPKKFLQYTTVEYAKSLLQDQQATLFDAAVHAGLSGTGRLHDLFIKIEGMTPGEFKNGGEKLSINYSFAETPFGKILVAATLKGICYIAFSADEASASGLLRACFPKAKFQQSADPILQNVLSVFMNNSSAPGEIKLHLKGTDFQLKVWQALLKIPAGVLSTYGKLASSIEMPNASRAVGTAIGSNPVAFLIPCHRVIQATGVTGGYMWGPARKAAMIGWEAANRNAELIRETELPLI